MRILFLDIDSLRPDRLGCYGYHRNTSPTIDEIAADGARLEYCYASDVPCCPSRSSLLSGSYGVHNGVVTHTGTRSVRFADPGRGFVDARDRRTLPAVLRKHGHRCAFISAFPTRHSAWHSLAGFHDWIDTGEAGHEIAPTVFEQADRWLTTHGAESDWFCHVGFWDVHTPYRTPQDYGDPFADEAGPAWPDAAVLSEHIGQTGTRSATDTGWSKSSDGCRQPHPIDSADTLAAFQNGYDTAIRYVDDHIKRLLERLESLGVADDTAIVLTADHGEDMGEFNAYGSHCFCGPAVARVPMILRWPGREGQVLRGLHQHFDLAATLLDLQGIPVPDEWDAQSFVPCLDGNTDGGRPMAISSNLAQALQRAVYWQGRPGAAPHCYLRTWDNWQHPVPDEAVIRADQPHAFSAAGIDHGRGLLEDWLQQNCGECGDLLDQVRADSAAEREQQRVRYRERLLATGRGALV